MNSGLDDISPIEPEAVYYLEVPGYLYGHWVINTTTCRLQVGNYGPPKLYGFLSYHSVHAQLPVTSQVGKRMTRHP